MSSSSAEELIKRRYQIFRVGPKIRYFLLFAALFDVFAFEKNRPSNKSRFWAKVPKTYVVFHNSTETRTPGGDGRDHGALSDADGGGNRDGQEGEGTAGRPHSSSTPGRKIASRETID